MVKKSKATRVLVPEADYRVSLSGNSRISQGYDKARVSRQNGGNIPRGSSNESLEGCEHGKKVLST